MGYKTPTYRFPTKYPDERGFAIATKRVSVPEYLLEEIEAIAQKLHQERMAKGTVPGSKNGDDVHG